MQDLPADAILLKVSLGLLDDICDDSGKDIALMDVSTSRFGRFPNRTEAGGSEYPQQLHSTSWAGYDRLNDVYEVKCTVGRVGGKAGWQSRSLCRLVLSATGLLELGLMVSTVVQRRSASDA